MFSFKYSTQPSVVLLCFKLEWFGLSGAEKLLVTSNGEVFEEKKAKPMLFRVFGSFTLFCHKLLFDIAVELFLLFFPFAFIPTI